MEETIQSNLPALRKYTKLFRFDNAVHATTNDSKKADNKSNICSFERIATVLSWILVVMTFPISIFLSFFTVKEFDRAVIFRLGRVRKGTWGPGLVWHLPCVDKYKIIDLRTRVVMIPPQDIITKDSVTISVDAVLFYVVRDARNSVLRIANVHKSTIFIAQTTLRNTMGSMTLHDILVSRQILSVKITAAVEHATEKWGVKVERIEVKNIRLPQSLERSLASEAEALREARAKIISADGELKASKALEEASDFMSKNPIALQLRHLQTLTTVAHEQQLTILYPFPIEMMFPFTEAAVEVAKQEPATGDGETNSSSRINETDDVTRCTILGVIPSLLNSLSSYESAERSTDAFMTPLASQTNVVGYHDVEGGTHNTSSADIPKIPSNVKSTQTDFKQHRGIKRSKSN